MKRGRPRKGTDKQVAARLTTVGRMIANLRRERTLLLDRMRMRRKRTVRAEKRLSPLIKMTITANAHLAIKARPMYQNQR